MAALDFIDRDLEELRQKGLLIRVREIGSAQGPWLVVDGKKVLNLCSNNYLGFANDPSLVARAEKAVREWGVGPGAVRSIAGHLTLHAELERKLAAFKGAEATLSLQSGFCANLATIPALVGKDDLIFSDELNHASIIDGCRLSGARIVRFAHADARSLDEALRKEKTRGKKLVIADGVFSMDGDVAPLPEYVDVAEKHGAIVMVDDAHGEGVLGKGGRGIVDHFGLHGRVHVEIGTLSKAFGVVGGFVAGSRKLIDYLRQKARPFLFSSAMTAADAAACIGAVDLLVESDARVTKLWDNTRYFQGRLTDLGFDIGKSATPITPVMIGDAQKAMEMSRKLFDEGVFAGALGYPTVPMGKARIRCMLSAGHSREDLDFALEAFQKVSARTGVEA